jgi:putative membrane protein
MHWSTDWNSGWFLGMHLAMWIFWIIVVFVGWAIVSRWALPGSRRTESPLEVLQRRYAEGALTTVEYEERRSKLAETAAAAH